MGIRMRDRSNPHLAIDDRNLHSAQRLSFAWAGDAFAALQFETGAVDGANQQTVFRFQEFTRRPAEAAAGMRTDIHPSADYVAIAQNDQGLLLTVDPRLIFDQLAVGHFTQTGDRDALDCRVARISLAWIGLIWISLAWIGLIWISLIWTGRVQASFILASYFRVI